MDDLAKEAGHIISTDVATRPTASDAAEVPRGDCMMSVIAI
jgi:hypothetical protein